MFNFNNTFTYGLRLLVNLSGNKDKPKQLKKNCARRKYFFAISKESHYSFRTCWDNKKLTWSRRGIYA